VRIEVAGDSLGFLGWPRNDGSAFVMYPSGKCLQIGIANSLLKPRTYWSEDANEWNARLGDRVNVESNPSGLDADGEGFVTTLWMIGKGGVSESKRRALIDDIDNSTGRQHPDPELSREDCDGFALDDFRRPREHLDARAVVGRPTYESTTCLLEYVIPSADVAAKSCVAESGWRCVRGIACRCTRQPCLPIGRDCIGWWPA
jgi:hypothetical protein